MLFYGEAIDTLYNPHQIIEKKLLQNDNNDMSMTLYKPNEVVASIEDEKEKISYEISWIFSLKDRNTPLILNSLMRIKFTKSKNISEIIDEYVRFEKLFKFIYNRSFIPFKEIRLVTTTEVKELDKIEEMPICFNLFITSSPKKIFDFPKRLFPLKLKDILGNYINILNITNESDYYSLHYPNNEEEDSYIDTDKFIRISAAFESGFDKLYPKYKSTTTPAYKESKDSVLIYINEKMQDVSGKRKKYYEKFYDTINNLEGLLEEQLNHSFKEFSDCINKEKERLCKNYDISTKTEYDLSKAFSNKRNNLAHGNIENKFSDLEITSYLLVKRLVHCITLKRAGFTIEEITKIINKIF